jgi:hypothetical protein
MTGHRLDTYRSPELVEHFGEVDAAGSDRVMVVGESAPRRCDVKPLTAAGWSVTFSSVPRATRGGVTVRWLSPWTGAPVPDRAEALRLWSGLERGCARWGSVPLGSPALTGRNLWERSTPTPIPVMSWELQELIRATSSQGRVEVFPATSSAPVELREYDQRLAYFAVARELPYGEPAHLIGSAGRAWIERNGYGRFRALVSWSAPKGWDRPGILRDESGRWGSRGTGWVDGAEFRVAELAGWKLAVAEVLAWERRGDPLRTWIERTTRQISSPPAGVSPKLWRSCWRNMVLHAIGAMHGRTGGELVTFDAEGRSVKSTPGNRCAHPEWTAAIWARARLRLLDSPAGRGGALRQRVGALHAQPGSVVAFQNDAVYLSVDPVWPGDDGAIGRLRFQRSTSIPVAWPRSIAEVRRSFAVNS